MIRSTLLILLSFISIEIFGQTVYQKDFDTFVSTVENHYAYLQEQQVDWKKVTTIYRPQVAQVQNKSEFIRLLENMLIELHNGHSSLNVNLKSSNRLVPSGQDIYVVEKNGTYWVSDVKEGSNAELAGLPIGVQIMKFNDKEIAPQLKNFLPKFTDSYTSSMKQFAIDMLFAGTHDIKRSIEILKQNQSVKILLDEKIAPRNDTSLLSVYQIDAKKVCIQINNCLWNNELISRFDTVLDSLITTPILVLDLSNTPNGGNSTVARSILGRFVDKPFAYQQHEYDEFAYQTKRHWVEYVYPRKTTFRGRLYVIVGHWTGSMGEGIAIGFDASKKALVVGTRMAGLLGAIESFNLPETNINFQIPTERLYHINGNAREEYLPKILKPNSEDTWKFIKALK